MPTESDPKDAQRCCRRKASPSPDRTCKRLRFSPELENLSEAAPPVDSAAVPARYPMVARERECETLDSFLLRSVAAVPSHARHAAGGCMYVSGGPGTGKTCSVRAAVAAWRRQNPETIVLFVNCMQLVQRSPTGLLKRVAELAHARLGTSARCATLPASGPGLVTAVASRLSQLGTSVVVIADEVDQVLDKRQNHKVGGPDSLETLVSLTQVPGTSAIALIAIANAVDLLERGGHAVLSKKRCETLLFQPYSAPQLKSILHARFAEAGEAGTAAAKALGPVITELRVRQVANCSGDCRQVVRLAELALFDIAANDVKPREEQAAALVNCASTAGSAGTGDVSVGKPAGEVATPQKPLQVRAQQAAKQSDPLASVKQLPMEQQMLLCALAASDGEAIPLTEVNRRYKDLCVKLHQPNNLACKDQVACALAALQERGLLTLRTVRRAAAGKPAGRGRLLARQGSDSDSIAELAVPCQAVRNSIKAANPLLEKCLD